MILIIEILLTLWMIMHDLYYFINYLHVRDFKHFNIKLLFNLNFEYKLIFMK